MPKSKVSKKAVYTPPPDRRTPVKARAAGPSSMLYKGVMVGLMLLGLAWLVVYYLAVGDIGFMATIGSWNLAIGFALMIAGLLMTMGWH
jgi:uncharacterized RDD family membrane protein YckC